MLFNSYSFIFGFLPVVLFGYFAAGRFGARVLILRSGHAGKCTQPA